MQALFKTTTMTISKNEVDALNLLVNIEITPEDYQSKVDNVLQGYKKRANIPGFRPGKVPMGLIKKQYGKAVLIEEINKILQDSIYNYINEEKLNILGNPMPVEQETIDFDNDTNFNFQFELGLSPELEVKISKRNKVNAAKLIADDVAINTYIDDMRSRFGKIVNPEKPEITDTFIGTIQEVDSEGNPVEDGLSKDDVEFKPEVLRTKKAQGELCKLANGESFSIQAAKTFDKDFNFAGLIGATDAQLEASTGEFAFVLTNVTRMELAELNQELFDKLYGEGVVTSEEEMRARVKEEAEKAYQSEADQYLLNNVAEYLIEKTAFDLPVAFLKKWLRTAGEQPLTEEQVEADWSKTEKGLRWQLIENAIIKMAEISVTNEELKAQAVELVKAQFMQYGQAGLDEEVLSNIAENVMKDQKEAQRITDQVYNAKLLAYYKENFKIEEEELTYEQFIQKVTADVEVNL